MKITHILSQIWVVGLKLYIIMIFSITILFYASNGNHIKAKLQKYVPSTYM